MTSARLLVVALAAAVILVAGLVGGVTGVAYLAAYAAATLPGWPIGFLLFGRRHPAAWIAGAAIGYGITAIALWVPIAIHIASGLAFALAWLAATAASWTAVILSGRPRNSALVTLPAWTSRTTRSLCLVLLLVPILVVGPFRKIGTTDEEGNRRYRAYFTADFVWHEALTAELAKFASPPRNPFLVSRPLHYYWGYFLLPAAITGTHAGSGAPAIETYLAVNALCTGVLFVSAIFVAAWAAVPRPGVAGAATTLVLLAASAEGLYATIDILQRGRSLAELRDLNIDAITSWTFRALTVDGLPRAIWYNPQHSLACTLGLIALVVAARADAVMSTGAAAIAGLALGLALVMSPFPGGALTLIYGIGVLWIAASQPRQVLRAIVVQIVAAAIVALALAWCVANGTFEGAGDTLAFGLSRRARQWVPLLGLALGPILVPAIVGLFAAARARFPVAMRPAIAGVTIALLLCFFVTLRLEEIWIGWRAGQILLVTIPALIACAFAWITDRAGRTAAIAFGTLLLFVGLPTTAIDAYNAQDTANAEMGPGFHWTVVLSPGEQDALRWIERFTPRDAVVQMSLEPRGRETWSLIPSFARRRMAAGLPISLLRTPEYAEQAARADAIFRSGDSEQAWRTARALRIDYLYVGAVERAAYGASLAALDGRPDLFARVFTNADAAVYQVR